MDIAFLFVTMFFCFLIGVPIAYSLGLAAIAASLYIGIPLEAVMLDTSRAADVVACFAWRAAEEKLPDFAAANAAW